MNLFYLILLINFSLYLSEGTPLGDSYPYTIKTGFNEAVTLMNNRKVAIYKTTKENSGLDNGSLGEDCITGVEKGAIYFDGYYYLSCLESSDPRNFRIKIFKKDFSFVTSGSDIYTYDEGSSIRFFKINSEQNYVGAAWLELDNDNTKKITLVLCTPDSCPTKESFTISGGTIARDIDCIYISKFQRIFCGLGFYSTDGKYDCRINMFTIAGVTIQQTAAVQETRNQNCNNHYSRKIRGNSDVNVDSDFIYYYFVDTDFKAFILKINLISEPNGGISFAFGNPIHIMNGCSQSQDSFDLAEDKFLGYYIFSCVDSEHGTKIKMQLFKIENDEAIFYDDKTIENYESFETDGEASMINFIVLKEELDFGYLSFGINTEKTANYIIFTRPACVDVSGGSISQGGSTDIDFNSMITSNNPGGGDIELVTINPGIKITPDNTVKNKFTFESIDYIIGDLESEFKVKNNFFESDICKVTVTVTKCFKHCAKCETEGTVFLEQKCTECKSGLFKMIFPLNIIATSSTEFNCCEKGVDCPIYLYENGNNYEICDEKCTTCEVTDKNKCITCRNNKQLQNIDISNSEREKLINYKLSQSGRVINYYKQEGSDDCFEYKGENEEEYYLDQNDDILKKCFSNCKKCKFHGNANEHNCTECADNYYPLYEDISTCEKEKTNYYKYQDPDSSKFYLRKCNDVCNGCMDSNAPDPEPNVCTNCAIGAYKKCSDINPFFECFTQKPGDSYFLSEQDGIKCYKECDSSCKTCDQEAGSNTICLSCDDEKVLHENKCGKNCPSDYKKLGKKCVLDCPPYTVDHSYVDPDDGETYYKCQNCKEEPDTTDSTRRQCIYMGTRHTSFIGKCIDCESLSQTFPANDYYGIRDDCYELCGLCSQRGTSTKMHCTTCQDTVNYPCLQEENGNCLASGLEIDYFVEKYEENPTTGDPECKYKKCYDTCKKCEDVGNILEHKCTQCKEGYQFDPNTIGNCVIMCPYYWYIDSTTNLFTCTTELKCPADRPYFTEINKGCYEQCSAVTHNVQRNFYRYKKTCVTQCPDNSMRDDKLYACHSLDDERDVFVYMANYVSQSTNVNNLLLYSSDGNKLFHLFNTTELGLKTYKNSSYNVGTSIIDLSNCINTLRHIEGLGRNDVLYIGVLDVMRNDTSAPQFEYTIFNKNGKKLDINYCKSNELVIEKSLNFSNNISLAKKILENYGYDIIDYQKDNKFFCDICSVFDYDKLDAYDVLLNDRFDYYYDNQNYYFCEDTCKAQSTKVDLKKLRVKCVCSGKANFTTYKKQSFQKYEKFTQNCKDEFLQYFKCGNIAFTKELFTKNVGNYFTFFFILFQIGNVFLYYFYSKKPMMSHINDVLVKRAKKGYEKDEISSSQSEPSESQTGSRQSGTDTGSGSQQSGSGSQRSGSRSYTGSVSQRSGSASHRSGSGSQELISENQSQSGNQEENEGESESEGEGEGEEGENGDEQISQSGSQSGSQNGSQSGSQSVSGSQSKSKSGTKSIKNSKGSKRTKSSKKNANPPKVGKAGDKKDKKEKTQYAFISIDNNNKKEEEKNKNENLETNDILNINNINNNIEQEQEEEKYSTGDKNAPNPAWKKYAKRYLNNENKYVDNEYREDSYNFDIPDDKKKKKKNSDDSSDEESNEEEESENSEIKKNSNNENSRNDDYDISEKVSENSNPNEKPRNRKSLKEKTEELPAANAPFKTDLEKFKDEIKKFEKFSLIELYWFILRKKHRIISLLIKKDIYDIFSIKLSLLILSYTFDFFVTTLFFFNFEIRKLFHLKRHLEPIYIIFMGLFCTLFSTFLIKVVDFLMEYRTDFRRYEILQKYENDRSNYFSSLNAMIKNFKQKMIIYYVIMFAFSIFVWYMVSAFIATYYNTKLIWGCMIGINFGLSNIFPFIYYFLGVLFQYKGIHGESYKMYKLGIIMLKI